MSELAFAKLSSQVDMLSFSERVRLLDKIVRSLHTPATKTAKTDSADFNAAFGLWKDRDVSIEEIRQKAWGRG